MAVNSITFGNINSADYGIYISGEGVFDAPKRAVEMVNVPGRSGAIALDQGYYENITVTYPAHNYEPDMADFKQALSDFRNALASQVGYQRLSDTFHPDEYRMAVFDEGLDINPIKYNTASQFDITFDCKPQRYLTSGETEITVESGDTLTNPTQYGSSPLLMVEGYGLLGFNGYEIELTDGALGNIVLFPADTVQGNRYSIRSYYAYLDAYPNDFNIGDYITFNQISVSARAKVAKGSGYVITKVESISPGLGVSYTLTPDGGANVAITYFTSVGGTVETGSADADIISETGYFKITYTYSGSEYTDNQSFTLRMRSGVRTGYQRNAFWVDCDSSTSFSPNSVTFSYNDITVDSTASILGHPTYIDCDLGEAYKIENGVYTSLNRYIALGSDLPTLAPGDNEITFDNTVTDLVVTPRWWRL